MGASAGYGHAVHDGMPAMHNLGRQVWPPPDVMVSMGAQDTLCKVATLSIGLEDTLAYHMAKQSAAGFKKGVEVLRPSCCY